MEKDASGCSFIPRWSGSFSGLLFVEEPSSLRGVVGRLRIVQLRLVSSCEIDAWHLTAYLPVCAMSLESYQVQLINRVGQAANGTFLLDEDDDAEECRLALQYQDSELTAVADDYFEAMCRIRQQLEPTGWIPLCYGASRQVYPSGMARNMGCRGLKAYKLRIGCHASPKDLVAIFDVGPDVEPVTVIEQAEFYKGWLRSLR
jgi:hypothetical protein